MSDRENRQRKRMKTMVSAVCLAVLAMCVTVPFVSDDTAAEGDLPVSVAIGPDGKTFTFTAASAGLWDLGDGTVVSDKASVTHTFAVSGLYRIVLTSADGTGHAAALVVDREPVKAAATHNPYNYCPGIVRTVSTDCPGLSWNPQTMSLTGTPTAVGTYTVTVTKTDSSVSTFQLTVTKGVAGLDEGFDAETDGLKVTVTAHSAGTPGIQYRWAVTDLTGKQVAVGLGASCEFQLTAAGTYYITCTITDASMSTSSVSQPVTVTGKEAEPEPTPEPEEKAPEIPMWILAAALVSLAAIVIIRVI